MGIFSRTEVDRPVDQVKVKVVEFELGEGIIEGSLDVLRVMLGVPELGCDEDVLALEARDVLERALDAFGDLLLILVADWCKKY